MKLKIRTIFCIAVMLSLCSLTAQAQYASQNITLNSGWNAVFVEVTPTDTTLDDLFGSTDVLGVFGWDRRLQPQQFEYDPQSPLTPAAHWRVWKPRQSAPREATLNTLFTLSANGAYLIQRPANAAPLTLSIKGQVQRTKLNWLPFAYNLVGFPVNPASPPTFADLLGPSDAFDLSQKIPGHIYAIRPDGGGQQIDQRTGPQYTTVDSGTAYWVKGGNPGDYVTPLDFGPGINELAFSEATRFISLSVRNLKAEAVEGQITYRASEPAPFGHVTPTAVPLAYFSAGSWVALNPNETIPLSLEAEQTQTIALAVRRDAIAQGGGPYAAFLELTDLPANGLRIRLPVRASDESGDSPLLHPDQGLWVGDARLTQVSAPYFSGTDTLPANGAMSLRLLLHVNEAGEKHLLQSVVLGLIPDRPGSEANFIHALWSGRDVSLPQETKEARRISSSAFPVMDPLPLSGDLSASLNGTLVIEPDSPQNPFLHPYHPDHDNRDARYNSRGTNAVEVPRIEREMQIQFEPVLEGVEASIFGSDHRAGVFRETIRGLRHEAIVVEGPFRLSRIIKTGRLNP